MAKSLLQLQLFSWFILVFIVIYAGLGAVVWHVSRSSQWHGVDEDLMVTATTVGSLIEQFELDLHDINISVYQPFDRRYALLAARDSTGTALAWDPRVDLGALPAVQGRDGPQSNITQLRGEVARRIVGRGLETRMVTQRLISKAGEVFYIDVAQTVGIKQRAPLSNALLLAGAGGLLSSILAAWLLLARATSPIPRLTAAIRQLPPGGFTLGGGHDDAESELRSELNRALARLEQTYLDRQQFLASIAHDLKTPVSVMLTESQVLIPENASVQDVTAYRDSVVEELRRLRGIIEGILTLAQVEQGEASLQRGVIPVDSIVKRCAANARVTSRAANVEIRTTLADPPPGDVWGDPDLLGTMLDNLVHNAIKFSRPGGKVDIQGDQAQGKIRIQVRDRGPGIPEEYFGRIFERFVRVPTNDGRESEKGTGLGLAIARAVCEAHGGTITVRNHPDGGCEFTVVLPAAA